MKEKGRVKKDRFKGIDNKLSLRVFLLQDQDEQKELGRLEAVERKEAAQDRDGLFACLGRLVSDPLDVLHNPTFQDMHIDTGSPWTAETKLEIQFWEEPRDVESKFRKIGYVEVTVGAILTDHARYYPLKCAELQSLHTGRSFPSFLHQSVLVFPPTEEEETGNGRGNPGEATEEGETGNDEKHRFCFTLETCKAGINDGHKFVLFTACLEERDKWVSLRNTAAAAAKNPIQQGRWRNVLMVQEKVRGIFQSNFVQGLTTLVIACAFITNIIDAELQADEASNISRMLKKLEIFYVYFFTVELVFNVLANVFWPFVIDLWNYLDMIVVIVCWISYLNPSSGGISGIRIVRVLRVVQVLKATEDIVRDEAEKHGKTFSAFGAEIQVKEGALTPDYQHDQVWSDLQASMKAREELLKMAFRNAGKATVYDESTGEAVPVCPAKGTKPSIAVTFKAS